MTRHRATQTPRPAVLAALQAACAAILLTVGTPCPAVAQVTKIQNLPEAYRGDSRLVAVVATGAGERRCIGATVGHFAVLTSYECLADWWNNTAAHKVTFATDPERRYAYEGFSRAWRGARNSRWAVLETAGHASGYYGYEDLERTTDADLFDFVGFSRKVKDGKQPAIQTRCRLTRVSPGVYTSACGADFGTSAILLLRKTGDQHYVSGLAWVRSEAKVDKRRVFTIETTSLDAYRGDLTTQRRDQDARYATVTRQRQAAVAEQRAANAEHEAEAEARRVARSERRRADLEKFGAALGQLAATLGSRGRTAPAPIDTTPAPQPRWTPPAAPAPAALTPTQPRTTTRGRWECGVQTQCVGNARAELAPGGMAQLRYVDGDGTVLAYMNVYWTSADPVEYGQRRLHLTVGIGSTSRCQLTSDMGFYADGRIQTFLGGVGTGPEVASMEYRKVTRTFSIKENATLTVGPGAAYCAGTM